MGRTQGGFTLVELMVVVAIVAILAAFALPSYNRYLAKSRRADAEQLMLSIDTRQKQLLLEQRQYAQAIGATNVASTGWTCSNATTIPGTCTNLYYSMTFNPATDNSTSPPTYTICATPQGSQAGDGVLTLDSTGARLRRSGTSCTSGSDLGW